MLTRTSSLVSAARLLALSWLAVLLTRTTSLMLAFGLFVLIWLSVVLTTSLMLTSVLPPLRWFAVDLLAALTRIVENI